MSNQEQLDKIEKEIKYQEELLNSCKNGTYLYFIKENILVESEDAKDETNNKNEDKNELADNSINNKKKKLTKKQLILVMTS